MKTVELIVADGCAIRTRNVELCNAATHIAANDRLATEARILEAIANDDSDSIPVAWKFADPTEDARLIYSESEASDIERIDPSLIVRIVESTTVV